MEEPSRTTRVYGSKGSTWLIGRPALQGKALEERWCPGEDSNLHGFHHWYLKPARLPIPPPGRRALARGGTEAGGAGLGRGSAGVNGVSWFRTYETRGFPSCGLRGTRLGFVRQGPDE